jgi:flagellar biosynthesis/type III secretory pathway M-ring protein FliF/YscJ
LLLLAIGFTLARLLRGRQAAAPSSGDGHHLSDLNVGMAAMAPRMPVAGALPESADPAATMRERARALTEKDPSRAAHVLKAWMHSDARPGVTNG